VSDQSIDSRILFRLETDGCLKEPHSRSQRRSLTGQKIHWGEHERYLLLTVHASPMYLLSPSPRKSLSHRRLVKAFPLLISHWPSLETVLTVGLSGEGQATEKRI